MDPIDLLAPYLDYIDAYLPALTLAGLLTFLVLDRLPTDWYTKQSENARFWYASALGVIMTLLVIVISGDVLPSAELPASLGEWALVLIAGALGPKAFYHLADLGDGAVSYLSRFKSE